MIAVIVVFVNRSVFAVRCGSLPVWPDVVSELVLALLATAWIVMLDPGSVEASVYYALWLGALLVVAGNIQDVLDEFYAAPPVLTTIENVATPSGMAFVTLGLLLWFRSTREAYRRLEETKERYEQLSRTDALTRLQNSRHYYEQLDLELERAQRYSRDLSLLFLDIDDFKAYNDAYGHVAGDKVLKSLGSVIRTNLRENDSGYRYGGEEFTVILPETSSEEALVVAERIRRGFSEIRFDQPGGSAQKTLSVGVTSMRPGDDPETLTKRADKAMYHAKLEGKNTSWVIA